MTTQTRIEKLEQAMKNDKDVMDAGNLLDEYIRNAYVFVQNNLPRILKAIVDGIYVPNRIFVYSDHFGETKSNTHPKVAEMLYKIVMNFNLKMEETQYEETIPAVMEAIGHGISDADIRTRQNIMKAYVVVLNKYGRMFMCGERFQRQLDQILVERKGLVEDGANYCKDFNHLVDHLDNFGINYSGLTKVSAEEEAGFIKEDAMPYQHSYNPHQPKSPYE
ncbi:MAG: hypothetical protein WC682_00980 [Parcubacteria group bacterium]